MVEVCLFVPRRREVVELYQLGDGSSGLDREIGHLGTSQRDEALEARRFSEVGEEHG